MNALPLKRRSIRCPIAPPHHVSLGSQKQKKLRSSPRLPISSRVKLGVFYCKVLNHADSGDSLYINTGVALHYCRCNFNNYRVMS